MHAAAVFDPHDVTAGGARKGCHYIGRRGHLGEFARVGWPHIGERVERPVGGVPQPKLVRLDGRAPDPGFGRGQR